MQQMQYAKTQKIYNSWLYYWLLFYQPPKIYDLKVFHLVDKRLVVADHDDSSPKLTEWFCNDR